MRLNNHVFLWELIPKIAFNPTKLGIHLADAWVEDEKEKEEVEEKEAIG